MQIQVNCLFKIRRVNLAISPQGSPLPLCVLAMTSGISTNGQTVKPAGKAAQASEQATEPGSSAEAGSRAGACRHEGELGEAGKQKGRQR